MSAWEGTMKREDILVGARDLKNELRRAEELRIIDASMIMYPALFDGNYKLDNGYQNYLNGHVPGSRYVNLLETMSEKTEEFQFYHLPDQVLRNALLRLDVSDLHRVVVYDCSNGVWAARLYWQLRAIGMDCRILDGGWKQWVIDGGRIETGDQNGTYCKTHPITEPPHPPHKEEPHPKNFGRPNRKSNALWKGRQTVPWPALCLPRCFKANYPHATPDVDISLTV